jgi:hypothetical protein
MNEPQKWAIYLLSHLDRSVASERSLYSSNKRSLEAPLLDLSSRAQPRDLRCAFLPNNFPRSASTPLSVANGDLRCAPALKRRPNK